MMKQTIFVISVVSNNTLALQLSKSKLLAPKAKAGLNDAIKVIDDNNSYISFDILDQKYQNMKASRGGQPPSPKAFDPDAEDAWRPFLTRMELNNFSVTGNPDDKFDAFGKKKFDAVLNYREKAQYGNYCGGSKGFCNIAPAKGIGQHNAARGPDLGQGYLEVIPTRHLINLPSRACDGREDECKIHADDTINRQPASRGTVGDDLQPWNYKGDFKIEYAKHFQEMVYNSLRYVQFQLDDNCNKGLKKFCSIKAEVAETDPNNRNGYHPKYQSRKNLKPGLIFPLLHTHEVGRSLTHMHVYYILDPEDERFSGSKTDPEVPAWNHNSFTDIFYHPGSSIAMSAEQVFRNLLDGQVGKEHHLSWNKNKKNLIIASL